MLLVQLDIMPRRFEFTNGPNGGLIRAQDCLWSRGLDTRFTVSHGFGNYAISLELFYSHFFIWIQLCVGIIEGPLFLGPQEILLNPCDGTAEDTPWKPPVVKTTFELPCPRLKVAVECLGRMLEVPCLGAEAGELTGANSATQAGKFSGG